LAEWTRRVEQWRRSGLTRDAFAEREGISSPQLAWWSGRLRTLARGGEAGPASSTTFVELVDAGGGLGVEVLLPGGALLRVPVGFDADTVTRLVGVLEGATR
jgi:hypothetical protein